MNPSSSGSSLHLSVEHFVQRMGNIRYSPYLFLVPFVIGFGRAGGEALLGYRTSRPDSAFHFGVAYLLLQVLMTSGVGLASGRGFRQATGPVSVGLVLGWLPILLEAVFFSQTGRSYSFFRQFRWHFLDGLQPVWETITLWLVILISGAFVALWTRSWKRGLLAVVLTWAALQVFAWGWIAVCVRLLHWLAVPIVHRVAFLNLTGLLLVALVYAGWRKHAALTALRNGPWFMAWGGLVALGAWLTDAPTVPALTRFGYASLAVFFLPRALPSRPPLEPDEQENRAFSVVLLVGLAGHAFVDQGLGNTNLLLLVGLVALGLVVRSAWGRVCARFFSALACFLYGASLGTPARCSVLTIVLVGAVSAGVLRWSNPEPPHKPTHTSPQLRNHLLLTIPWIVGLLRVELQDRLGWGSASPTDGFVWSACALLVFVVVSWIASSRKDDSSAHSIASLVVVGWAAASVVLPLGPLELRGRLLRGLEMADLPQAFRAPLLGWIAVLMSLLVYAAWRRKSVTASLRRGNHALPFGLAAALGSRMTGESWMSVGLKGLLGYLAFQLVILANDFFDQAQDGSAGGKARPASASDMLFSTVLQGFLVWGIGVTFPHAQLAVALFFLLWAGYHSPPFRLKRLFCAAYKIEGVGAVCCFWLGATTLGFPCAPWMPMLTLLTLGGFSLGSMFKDYKDIDQDRCDKVGTVYTRYLARGFSRDRIHRTVSTAIALSLLVPPGWLLLRSAPLWHCLTLLVVAVAFWLLLLRSSQPEQAVERGLWCLSGYLAFLVYAMPALPGAPVPAWPSERAAMSEGSVLALDSTSAAHPLNPQSPAR